MRQGSLFLAGVLMGLSAFAHALLGWPAMNAGLEGTGATEDLVGGLSAGWYFGSVAMAAFGVMVLVSAIRLRRGDRSGLLFAGSIGGAYVLFGVAAFVFRDFNPHFLGFVVIGCLAGIPALGRQG